MPRTAAAAQLWESADALANLRQLLSRMQKALPLESPVLGVDDKWIWLFEPVRDVDAAWLLASQECLGAEELRTVVDVYGGPPLQGQYDLGRALHEEAEILRNRFHGKFLSILWNSLKEITRYGNAAQDLLNSIEARLLELDARSEDHYRLLIEAYGSVGRPNDARRLYDQLVRVLEFEGEQGPQAQTRQSLAVATTRRIIRGETALSTIPQANAQHVPRVALLAPRWFASGSIEQNIVPAMVEDIANELARYRTFVTLAAHSSFQAQHDGGIIGDNSRLRADYTLSSFLRPHASRMGDFCVRLVQCETGTITWSGEFALGLDSIVNTFRTMVGRIAAQVSYAVESDTLHRLEGSKSTSAYLHYLRAQDVMRKCTLGNVRRARKHYAEAIKEDSRFAQAYSGACATLYLEWLLLGGNESGLLTEAREAVEAAIRIDPESSAGHWRKAMVGLYQRDFDESEKCFVKARDLHPNSADIMLDYGDAMGFVGDPNQAWSLFQNSLDLNPMPPDHYWWAGASIAFSRNDYQTAIYLCGNVQSEEPVLRLLAASHGQLGNLEEAQKYGNRLKESYPGQTAESMTRLQPHRTKKDLQSFIDGLRIAGIS